MKLYIDDYEDRAKLVAILAKNQYWVTESWDKCTELLGERHYVLIGKRVKATEGKDENIPTKQNKARK